MRVLIAEDSAVERLIARRTVESLGHECLVAGDGEEAWQLFKDVGADVVLSDWLMPRLDGAELCRRVRALGVVPYTYVILLTVLDDRRHAVSGMHAGADEYLTKPLKFDALERCLIAAERVTALHRHLAQQQAQRERAIVRRDQLLALAQRLAAHNEPDRLLADLLGEAAALLGCSAASVGRWDETHRRLVGVQGVRDASVDALHLRVTRDVLSQAVHRRVLVTADESLRQLPDDSAAGGCPVNALAVPLLDQGRLLGALSVVIPERQGLAAEAPQALEQLATVGAAALGRLERSRAIQDKAVGADAGERPHNLPAAPTPLIGRHSEVQALRDLLRRPEVRLVTITGPAGVGKSRLALAAAAGMLDTFIAGARFIDLSGVEAPALVLSHIAQAVGLGIRPSGNSGLLERVCRALVGQRLLLVLDNFEQVLPAAGLVGSLAEALSGVKLLVTSRTPLHLRWEHVLRLQPLRLPVPGVDDLARVAEAPAVALYVERVKAVRPSFALGADNARSVVDMCARLDGLPLALELAAARTTIVPPEALSGLLDGSLAVLSEGPLDLPERQRSLRRAIHSSYALLGPHAQRLFRRVAVFAAGFTEDAATAVCEPAAVPDVSAELGVLLEHSLVTEEPQLHGERRFGLLHTVRQFARDELSKSGELESTQRQHAAYFAALAERSLPGLRSREQRAWLGRLEHAHEDLRAALRWSVEAGDAETELRLVGALWRFWYLRGHLQEAARWLEGTLGRSLGVRGPARARVLEGAAMLAAAGADWNLASGRLETAVEAWRELGEQGAAALGLAELAFIQQQQRQLSTARALASQAVALARQANAAWSLAGTVCRAAQIALGQGQYPAARVRFSEALTIAHELGDQWLTAVALEGLGCVFAATGQPQRALRQVAGATGLREALKTPRHAVDQAILDWWLARCREALGPASVAEAPATSSAMAVGELVAEALGGAASRDSAGASVTAAFHDSVLTRREREVAALVAQGHSNRQISELLAFTEKTAEAHVSNILHKLELTSRAQLAAWVLNHQPPPAAAARAS